MVKYGDLFLFIISSKVKILEVSVKDEISFISILLFTQESLQLWLNFHYLRDTYNGAMSQQQSDQLGKITN